MNIYSDTLMPCVFAFINIRVLDWFCCSEDKMVVCSTMIKSSPRWGVKDVWRGHC
jgi:hypothetical protein